MSYRCDCDDSIEHLTVEELIDEINSRRKYGEPILLIISDEDIALINRALSRNDVKNAQAYLDSALYPKWRNPERCRVAYLQAMTPPPKEGLWFHI